jgi:hypothetical protein
MCTERSLQEGTVTAYDESTGVYALQIGDEQFLTSKDGFELVVPKTPSSKRARLAVRMGETLEEVEQRLGTGTIKSACFNVLKAAGPAGT